MKLLVDGWGAELLGVLATYYPPSRIYNNNDGDTKESILCDVNSADMMVLKKTNIIIQILPLVVSLPPTAGWDWLSEYRPQKKRQSIPSWPKMWKRFVRMWSCTREIKQKTFVLAYSVSTVCWWSNDAHLKTTVYPNNSAAESTQPSPTVFHCWMCA